MRYLLLLLVTSLLTCGLEAWGYPVKASQQRQTTDVTAQFLPTPTPSPDFWTQAQRVVQEQIYTIARLERAFSEPDLRQAEVIRQQLPLHLGKVDRFLKSQYQFPRLLCTNAANGSSNSNLSAQQLQVYCALDASSQQLASLGEILDWRMARLADLSVKSPVPSTTRERFNFRVPALSRFLPAPNLPPAEPPAIGIPAKTPIADYMPPFQPAIALPEQAATNLKIAKQLLAPAIAAFPTSTSFTDPKSDALAIDRLSYGLYPKDPPLFANFLARPNTGIVRVLPAQAYRPNPNQMRSRLQPTVAERFPFAALLSNTSGFTPRLTLRTENDNFEIAQPGLDYGFMADLGDIPIENLDASLKDIRNLSPQTRQFFLNYRPPTQLAAIQADRQRFITGKQSNFPLSEPVLVQAPAVLNHTYLLRLVQYELPEVILTSRTVSRRDRRYLDQILQTPSSDLLVAFRPVVRRSDGSYTVLWQVLDRFPDPKITDMETYIYLE